MIVGGTRVLTHGPGATTAYSVPLDDPTAPAEATPYPSAVLHDTSAPTPVPVGDRVLFIRASTTELGGVGGVVGPTLLSVPVGGGAAQTLLAGSGSSYAVTPDGSVLVVGGTGPDDWAVRRITAAPGADPAVSTVRPLTPVPARIYGLAYSAGQLVYSTDTTSTPQLLSRDVGPGATPTVGSPVRRWYDAPAVRTCATSTPCAPLQGLGTGTVAYPVPGTDFVNAPVPTSADSFYDVETGANDNAVSDASDGYTLITSPGQHKQWVADLGSGYTAHTEVTRTTTAAALWGHILWVPGTAGKGSARPYNLLDRTFGTTFQTAATCSAFTELQADDRWLYWSCGTTAGVFDWKTGRNIPVPAGSDTLLGDGYLVRHDRAAGKLVLTVFSSGTAVTSSLADLPAGTLTGDDRGITWSVDKYGGGVAYTDAAQRIHLLPLADLSRQPLNLLRSFTDGANLDGTAVLPFSGQWDYSRPVGAWTLAVKNAAGQVVATRSGTSSSGNTGTSVSASWDLTTSAGHYAAAGTYTWSLTAHPRDGQGAALTTSGSVLLGGGPAAHDYTGDKRGDVLGVTGAGRFDVRPGTSTGGVTTGATGTGWGAATTFVPYGDLNGDRTDDLLTRDFSGRLWLYPGHGKSFAAGDPHVQVGVGFTGYDALFSAGDLTGDGRPDLLARTPSGALFRYADNDAGGFTAPVKIGTGWNAYNLLTGSSGQLYARDSTGTLWRFTIRANGTFAPRVRVGTGWTTYNAVVSPGDLTTDGRPDLVARDSTGTLWRYAPKPDGTFAPRVKLGAGWQQYRVLL
nr:FG-GAP-like repeat-containing protein [Streptomyces sp. SID4948]